MTFALQEAKFWEHFSITACNHLNWNPIWIIIKINKNGFGNSLRKYKTLIKIYKKLQPRYRRYAQVLFRKNSSSFISQPNGNQKTSENRSRNAISYKNLPQNRPHLVSYMPFNTVSIRISPIILAKSRMHKVKLKTWRFQYMMWLLFILLTTLTLNSAYILQY